ncbi:MAG: hypothetical protein HC890_15810, partial [Chloroflexaceae bacterium]|nr:hypothetical protein [Chloroflexaceae bacterium]
MGVSRCDTRSLGLCCDRTALFVGAGLVSWWYAWRDPSFIALIVPENLISVVRDEGKLVDGIDRGH